jgi:hypothetical protein
MTAYETRISGLSPKIWVKFDSTGVITDSGSAATSWTLAGTAPTYSVSGISNSAYTFAGNGRYTSTTALPTNTFNDKIFTVEAWVKLTSQSTVDYPTIFRINNPTDGHYFLVRGRANDLTSPGLAEIYYDGGTSVISYYSTTRIDDGNWHHIVFVANGNTDSKLYVDGILENSSATNIGTLSLDGSAFSKRIGGEATNEDFVGTIDEVAVYSEALTSTQIARNYATGITKATLDKLLSYSPQWSFNFDRLISGTTYLTNQGSEIPTDLAGYPFTNTNTVTKATGSYPGGPDFSCEFSASGKIAYSATLQVWNSEVTDADYTFGMWFKLAGTVGTANTMIMNGGPWISAGTAKVLGSTNGSNSGKLSVYAINGTTYTLAGKRVDDGNWHFLAFRQTGTSGANNAQIYLDGVLEQQFTTTSSPSGSYLDFGNAAQSASSTTMTLGNFFIGTSANYTQANLLAIYETAYVPVIPVTINETPATASAQFPDAGAAGTSTVSVSDTPATASGLMTDPALSFTNDVSFGATFFTAFAENIPAVTVTTVSNIDYAAGAATANADFSATTGISIDDAFTAAPSTANVIFALIEPTVTAEKASINTVTPMTASSEAGGRRYLREVDPFITEDRMYKGLTGGWDPADFQNLRFENTTGSSTSDTNYFVLDTIPARVLSNRNNLKSARLEAYIADLAGIGGTSVTLTLHRILSPWTEADAFQPTISASQGNVTITLPATNNVKIDIDLTPLIDGWISGTYPNYGFALQSADSTTGWRIHSSETATTAYKPKVVLTVDYGLDDAEVQLPVATASALMVDPNLNIGTATSVTSTVLTASAFAVDPAVSAGLGDGNDVLPMYADIRTVDPVVSVQRSYNFTQSDGLSVLASFVHPITATSGANATIDSAPITASAAMGNALPSINESTPAPALTALAAMVDPTILSDFNRIVYVGAFSVNAVLIDPVEAVLESDDPYYQEILKTSNLYDAEWFRLDEVSGSIAYSKTKALNPANLQANGTYTGSPLFGNVGPRNRKVVGFSGSQYITLPHTYGASTTGDYLGAASSQVAEMTIKTVSTVGTLLDGEDANTLAGAGNPIGWTVDLVEGKLRYRKWVVATNVPGTNRLVEYQIIGNKRIDDNQWHHIVIQIGNLYNSKDIEIFIDGELDIARFAANDTPIMAHPDRLFGNTVTTMNFAYTGPNPTNQVGSPEPMPNFTGEVMEYVFRPNLSLTEYQIEQLYYAALDIATEPAEAFTATAVLPEPYVTGNKPKALLLSFWPYSDYLDTPAFAPRFDETPDYTRLISGGFDPESYDVWEYYVNRVSANPQIKAGTTPGINPTTPLHRDPVTDDVVLLDPRTIKNVDKFDVIKINGYPIDSDDITNIFQGYNEDKGYQFALKSLETFIERVRSLVDNYGLSLLITNPRLAVDFGIVDDIEETNSFFEKRYSPVQSSHNAGNYDYRSSQLETQFPELGVSTTASPYEYFDTHRNNKLRIVATETGLTDIQGGWSLQDVINHRSRDPLQIERYHYKYKDSRTGLTIGDELIINNSQTSGFQMGGASGDTYGVIRAEDPIVAFPPSAVKAGTVIATLGATYWNLNAEVANPYANYAAVIICKPGDNVKGTTLGGKILVDCSEVIDTRYSNVAVFQTTDGNADTITIPDNSVWQYSTSRLIQTGAFSPVNANQTVKNPEAFKQQSIPKTSATILANETVVTSTLYTSQLFSIIVEEEYPTVNVWAPSLLERGILWLQNKVVINPNDASIKPQAFVAIDEMPTPTIYINKSNSVNAAAMLSTSKITEPVGISSADVAVTTLPLVATATLTGYGKIFAASPMTATAILNTDTVTFVGGEQVTVTLHEALEIDLNMKEETY